MDIDISKTELEILQHKLNSFEKENQELRQELTLLQFQIQPPEVLDNDFESMLAAFPGEDWPLQIPASPTDSPAPVQVRQVPELLELYTSLTETEEGNSAYILKVKSKVESFVEWLIKAVNSTTPKNIMEAEGFVKWFDEELALLADENAVLKHFPQWPKRKVDALREATSTYRDLKNLENEVCLFGVNPMEGMNVGLRRIIGLQNRVEKSVRNMERIRDCKKFENYQIPCNWMLDSAVPTKMKLSSLRLVKEFIQMITRELQSNETPQSYNLFLHGVHYAHKVHQFAGGYDSEAKMAFEQLKKVGLGLSLIQNVSSKEHSVRIRIAEHIQQNDESLNRELYRWES